MDSKLNKVITMFSVTAMLISIFFVFYFFLQLNSTVSVFSAGDITVYLQSYFNFYNGRPFQNTTDTEFAGQFINNYPYLSILVWHSYFLTSVFISAIYYLFPDINTMFLIYILFDYAGIAYFTYKILKKLSNVDYKLKVLLSISIFAISGYLRIVLANGTPSQIVGPFILAAYYYLIDNKKIPFIITTILICLIQDDFTLFIITFVIYIIIFEKPYRSYVYFPMIFAIIYFGIWNIVLQPAIRSDLVNLYSSQLSSRLSSINIGTIITILKTPLRLTVAIFAPALLYVFTIFILYFSFDRLKKVNWVKMIGLALIAPCIHLMYGIYTYADRHLAIVFTIYYLMLVLIIGNINFNYKKTTYLPLYLYLTGVLFAFTIINFLYLGGLPYTMEKHTYWADKIENYLKGYGIVFQIKKSNIEKERVTNKYTIAAINNIPLHNSIVYWTNDTVEGFIVNRNDIWRFPMYYDVADYLIIQKDSTASIYPAKTKDDINYKKPGAQDKHAINFARDWTIPKALVDEIKEDLVVKQKTHIVRYDGEHILIIERLNKYKFFMPPSSLGFGWIKNIKF
ncbi:MAG: hypothetical protein HQL01_07565 [Nitrospirae bacterium]|nr:hypothetical protein [Nitrospirota bacterium]